MSKSSCVSNLIGLVLVGGMAFALLMLGFSLRDLLTGDSNIAQDQVVALATPTLRPTMIPATLVPVVEPTPQSIIQPTTQAVESLPADSGWASVQSGLEVRTLSIFDSDTGRQLEQMTMIRLDPSQFRFDVGYSPSNPKTLDAWQRESEALLAVNGGYFTAEYLATGLTIVNGETFGSSYGPFAGMVSIERNGVGDGPASNLDVRWLRQSPYSSAENLWGGFQSFPILVHSGGEAAFPAESDNGDRSRRTAIGKDASGRILIIIAGQGWFTLSEFSSWLAQSDLNLRLTLNLDGGTSTGLILDHPERRVQLLSFSPLPTVLLVYNR